MEEAPDQVIPKLGFLNEQAAVIPSIDSGRSLGQRYTGAPAPVRYPRKPSVGVVKLPMLGKMEGKLAVGTPNHFASVPPYWSTDVVGIQRPLLPASLGPPGVSMGNWP